MTPTPDWLNWARTLQALAQTGLISFAAVAQFAPAFIVGLVWKRATARGAKMGLIAGFAIWFYTLFLPSFADAGWIGEAGPGPSYLDKGSGGPENDFTNRNTTFMTWNLMHLAKMLKDAGGVPGHGNQRSEWNAGTRLDYENPDYRS